MKNHKLVKKCHKLMKKSDKCHILVKDTQNHKIVNLDDEK